MGFTTKEGMVRVDRFKERGKWYDTHEVDMSKHYNADSIHDALEECLRRDGVSLDGFVFVCLEPYHKFSHPVMLMGRK